MIVVFEYTKKDETCLCGTVATELRQEQDGTGNVKSEEFFCTVCGAEADALTPADLI
jgi:hypothetical protein